MNGIDEQSLIINLLAQDKIPSEKGLHWFLYKSDEGRSKILRELYFNIRQSGQGPEAATNMRVNSAYSKQAFNLVKMDKTESILKLPPKEYGGSFLVLLDLYKKADRLRKDKKCGEQCSHWWHHNLDSYVTRLRSDFIQPAPAEEE